MLHKSALAFGRLPDMSTWRLGDVVLMAPNGDSSRLGGAIREVQHRHGFGGSDSSWTHAALFVGNGEVVDVTSSARLSASRVKVEHMSLFVPRARLRLRSSPFLTDAQRSAIAERGRKMSTTAMSYSPWKAFLLAVDAYGATEFRNSRKLLNQVVCSDIVALAYDGILRRPVFGTAERPSILPATLSATDFLADSPVSWCAIPAFPASA